MAESASPGSTISTCGSSGRASTNPTSALPRSIANASPTWADTEHRDASAIRPPSRTARRPQAAILLSTRHDRFDPAQEARVKFDLFYQLPKTDSQNVAARYRELLAEAIEADRLGFDTLWLAEVHFAPHFCTMPAPMMLLAVLAQHTTRLRLGLAVNLMP